MTTKITDTIKQDLIINLQGHSELPFNLTLGAIADYYSVSLTPVREVIAELLEEEMITRKSNGRLERNIQVNLKHKGKKTKVTNIVSLDSDMDEKVMTYIVQLSLKSHSEYLREEATAKMFDTGRTVMRQVFSRLAGAGFIEHVPRCGWKVRNIREKDMSDYLETREILEIKALTLARPFLNKEDLQSLLSSNVASDNPLLASLDNDLHNYWIRLCDNKYIQDFFERHGSFYTAVFEYASLGDHVLSDMAQEHRDILENLIDNNWKEAEKALIKHIRDQRLNLLEQLGYQG
jgi:DNA-binding GntR family transcriptional regulator